MIIYNVTINIDEKVQQSWLEWMREEHIPDMLATGKFTEAKMSKVLVEEEMGGVTYSVQYTALNRESLERYYNEDAPRLRRDTQQRFGEHFVAFRTELEVLDIQQKAVESATEHLFVYGTLLESEVRQLVFARELDGKKDMLAGYRIHRNKVSGLYPSVEATGQDEDQVSGEVFVVSNDDLRRADQYEGEAYMRKRVTLASGTEAWVYQEKSV
ncbi:DUF4286 family protein [Lentiprolixibacter aurantiacus]|uniref:DUF4286 family protein n=1 Tax=Lentiprolixibacter aurantiacus TaxID=2993939 RepID=UPI0034E2E48E